MVLLQVVIHQSLFIGITKTATAEFQEVMTVVVMVTALLINLRVAQQCEQHVHTATLH